MSKRITFKVSVIIAISVVGVVLYGERKSVNLLRYKLMGWDQCLSSTFEHKNYKIRDLAYENLPYISPPIVLYPNHTIDDNGVPLRERNGEKYYHPVYLVQHCLQLLHLFHASKDAKDLAMTIEIIDKLGELSLEVDSAILVPYVFNYVLHGRRYMDEMKAPWYSAMAQGQMLSVLTRLFEETKDSTYLMRSERIYNSFSLLKVNGDPWLSCIDRNSNLWLEEYPCEMPCFTLNGMIFAIYGVYDFYRVTKRDDVKIVLSGAITTIENNIVRYRNPGDVSYYCLKHKVKSLAYHNIHSGQLDKLYQITGEEYFRKMSEKFASDAE